MGNMHNWCLGVWTPLSKCPLFASYKHMSIILHAMITDYISKQLQQKQIIKSHMPN